MSTDPDRTRFLQCYPSLATLPEAALSRLLDALIWLSVPAGAQLFDDRQSCQGFPFVTDGSVRVVKSSPNGRTLPLYRVESGETCVISSSCLLGRRDYNARGLTEASTRLALLPPAVFEELLGQAVFRDFVFALFSERIAELMQLIDEVAFHRLDQRLAAQLLGKGRTLHTTHKQLADELGSVREIVTRLLRNFADQGMVRLSREQIDILDPAGLREIAAGGG